MPIHDYRCSACGQSFELLVRSSSEPVCPHCGAATLERQISRIAPAGKSQGLIAGARRAAAKEGHFSNYSQAERARVPK